ATRLRAQRGRLGDLLLARPGIRVRDLDRGGPDRGGPGTAPAVPHARRAAHRHHRGPRTCLGRGARPALRGRDCGGHPGGPRRAPPSAAVEVVPLWGFACGVATGCVTGVLAAFSGGPLGSGRLAAVGPSGWQAAVVAVLEVGVAAAVAAGLANWLRVRRDPVLAAERARRLAPP